MGDSRSSGLIDFAGRWWRRPPASLRRACLHPNSSRRSKPLGVLTKAAFVLRAKGQRNGAKARRMLSTKSEAKKRVAPANADFHGYVHTCLRCCCKLEVVHWAGGWVMCSRLLRITQVGCDKSIILKQKGTSVYWDGAFNIKNQNTQLAWAWTPMSRGRTSWKVQRSRLWNETLLPSCAPRTNLQPPSSSQAALVEDGLDRTAPFQSCWVD